MRAMMCTMKRSTMSTMTRAMMMSAVTRAINFSGNSGEKLIGTEADHSLSSKAETWSSDLTTRQLHLHGLFDVRFCTFSCLKLPLLSLSLLLSCYLTNAILNYLASQGLDIDDINDIARSLGGPRNFRQTLNIPS